MNCKSKDVIYVLTCAGCGEQCVGETGGMLKDRMTLHRQHINNAQYRTLGVSKHISLCGSGKYTVTPFYRLYNSNDDSRRQKESDFIKLFKPTLNTLRLHD